MGIHRIKGLSTARGWYCALGFGIALVTMGAIFWIAWCYFGLSIVKVTESQRRAIVDYSYIAKPSSSTTSPTIPSVAKDGTSIESSLNTISRTVTESTFSRGSNKGDSPLDLKLRKKKEESILPTVLAKGDFASRNRTPPNAAPAVEPFNSTDLDKGRLLPPVSKEETTAISNNDGLLARSPPNPENRPSFEASSSRSSSSSLSTGTQFSSRDDGSSRNYDSAKTSLRADEKNQSSRQQNADPTTRTPAIEDFPSDTRRTRNDDERDARKQDDRIGRDSARQNDDRNSPRQFNDNNRDPRRPDDDRSSARRYEEDDKVSIRKTFEDDKVPSRRYENVDRGLTRRYDEDRDLPRRYVDDDRGLPRRYEDDDRGLTRHYRDEVKSPPRRYEDDVRRPIIRDENVDKRPIRRNEDDDIRPIRRNEDDDPRPIRRYEDDDRRPIRRYEDDDRRPIRRYEDDDRRPIRRYEDDDRRPIRRYEDDDRRPIRRYEDDDIRPIRRYEDDDKESSGRHDDRFSKGDFNTKPPLLQPKVEDSRHLVETKLRGNEERYRDRDYDPRYRNRDDRYRDDDIRDRYAKDDPRYESRPVKDESTYDDQYKSSQEPYPPRQEDRDLLKKRTDETISLDRKYVSRPDSARSGGGLDPASLDGQFMKTFPNTRNDRVDSSIRDDRVVREYLYTRDDSRPDSPIVDERDIRSSSVISDDRKTRRLSSGTTDDRSRREPDYYIEDEFRVPYSSKKGDIDVRIPDSTLKDDRRVYEGTDDDRYRYRPSDSKDNSGYESTKRGTSIDDRYLTRDDQYRSRYDKTDRIVPTRVRGSLDLPTEDRYNERTRYDEKDKIVPTKVRGEIYTSRSNVDSSRYLPSDERKKDERVIDTRYKERHTGDNRDISPTIIESSRTRDTFRPVDTEYVERGDKVMLDRRSYASEDEYRRSNSRTRPPYSDDDEYRRPSRTNADEHSRTRTRDDDDDYRYYDREYRRDRGDGFYDRSDERSNRRTYETPRTRDKDDTGLRKDLSSSESVDKERRGQIPSRYPEDAANPHVPQIGRRHTDDVPRTSIKHDEYDRSPIHTATDSEEVSSSKRFQQAQSDKRRLHGGIEETTGTRSGTSESGPERPVNTKDVIEAALRQSDRSDHNPKNVFYPVFDPRMSNLTSPDIIRPSERRGTTILSRKKRRLMTNTV